MQLGTFTPRENIALISARENIALIFARENIVLISARDKITSLRSKGQSKKKNSLRLFQLYSLQM